MKCFQLLIFCFVIFSCAKKDRTDVFDINRTRAPEKQVVNASEIIDLENKGIGPIKEVNLESTIDEELAKTGEELFNASCSVCHKVTSKFIGPALQGVTQRRTPEWIMNMILNTQYMLRDDPLAKALFMEFNGSPMTNVGFDEAQARAVLEYLRTKEAR